MYTNPRHTESLLQTMLHIKCRDVQMINGSRQQGQQIEDLMENAYLEAPAPVRPSVRPDASRQVGTQLSYTTHMLLASKHLSSSTSMKMDLDFFFFLLSPASAPLQDINTTIVGLLAYSAKIKVYVSTLLKSCNFKWNTWICSSPCELM